MTSNSTGTKVNKNIQKYSGLLSNILNIQENKLKLEKDSLGLCKNDNKASNRPLTTAKTGPKQVIVLNNTNNNKQKPRLATSVTRSSTKPSTVQPGDSKTKSTSAVLIKPILKRSHSTLSNVRNGAESHPTARFRAASSSRVRVYPRSKSAECLLTRSSSRQKANSLNNVNCDDGDNVKRRARSNSRESSKTQPPTENFLKEFDLIESFFNKSRHMKPLEKRQVFTKLFSFMLETNKQMYGKNLETKLDQMKNELNELKGQLHTSSNVNTSRKQPAASPNLDLHVDSIANDFDNGLNKIVTTYSNNLIEIEQKLEDIKHSPSGIKNGDGLLIKNPVVVRQESFKNCSTPKKHVLAMTPDYVERLERELKESNEKCRMLQSQLDEKTKKANQYIHLFKEINESIGTLIKELGEKDSISKSKLLSLHTSLVSSEQNLKEHPITVDQGKAQNYLPIVSHKSAPLQGTSQFKTIVSQEKQANFKDCSTTTSDTLIDADCSFAADSIQLENNFNLLNNFTQKPLPSFVHHNQQPQQQQQHNLHTQQLPQYHVNKENAFKNSYFSNANNNQFMNNHLNHNFNYLNNLSPSKNQPMIKKNQFVIQPPNYDQDDDDEEEKIIISMDELSITTIQSSSNDSETTTTNETSSSTLNVFNNNTNNNNIKNIQKAQPKTSSADDQFQQDLKKLDQKILKVKQLLESMKSS